MLAIITMPVPLVITLLAIGALDIYVAARLTLTRPITTETVMAGILTACPGIGIIGGFLVSLYT